MKSLQPQSQKDQAENELEKVTGNIPSIIAPEEPFNPDPQPEIEPTTPSPEVPAQPENPNIPPPTTAPINPESPTEPPPHIDPLRTDA